MAGIAIDAATSPVSHANSIVTSRMEERAQQMAGVEGPISTLQTTAMYCLKVDCR